MAWNNACSDTSSRAAPDCVSTSHSPSSPGCLAAVAACSAAALAAYPHPAAHRQAASNLGGCFTAAVANQAQTALRSAPCATDSVQKAMACSWSAAAATERCTWLRNMQAQEAEGGGQAAVRRDTVHWPWQHPQPCALLHIEHDTAPRSQESKLGCLTRSIVNLFSDV